MLVRPYFQSSVEDAAPLMLNIMRRSITIGITFRLTRATSRRAALIWLRDDPVHEAAHAFCAIAFNAVARNLTAI